MSNEGGLQGAITPPKSWRVFTPPLPGLAGSVTTAGVHRYPAPPLLGR